VKACEPAKWKEEIVMDISIFMVIVGALLFLAVPVGIFFAVKYLIRYNAIMKAKGQ